MDRKTFLMTALSPFLALGADNKVDSTTTDILSRESNKIYGKLVEIAPTFSRYFGEPYSDGVIKIHSEIQETLMLTSNLFKESLTTVSFVERNNKQYLKIEVRTLLQLNNAYTYMYMCIFVGKSEKDEPEHGMYRYNGTDGEKSLLDLMTKVTYAENSVEKCLMIVIDDVKGFSLAE